MIDRNEFLSGFTWDEGKRLSNLEKHGVDFASVDLFDFETALIRIDDRADYGECREVAVGFIAERLHVLVFTRRAGAAHIISLRKANDRERKLYGG